MSSPRFQWLTIRGHLDARARNVPERCVLTDSRLPAQKFVSLESPGDLTPTLLYGTGGQTLREYQKVFLGDLFQESLGFAGAKIVR